jgi:transposase
LQEIQQAPSGESTPLETNRDPKKLAALRDGRIKASEHTIIKSLVGDYRWEHLFTLRQSLAAYRNHKKLIAETDREIERHLKTFDAIVECGSKSLASPKVRRRKLFGNEPSFDLRGHLYRIFGVDPTEVPGVSILRPIHYWVGPDLSRFPSASAFVSGLGSCPDNDIRGEKVAEETRPVNDRTAWALRMAPNALRNSRFGPWRLLPQDARQIGSPVRDHCDGEQAVSDHLQYTDDTPRL